MNLKKATAQLQGNSHPNKLLKDHLFNTLNIAEEIKQFHNLTINVEKEILSHDVAKAHPDFQKYFMGRGAKFPHSEPSSKLTMLLTKSLTSAETVRRHHSYFDDFERAKSFWLAEYSEQMLQEAKEFNSAIQLSQRELDDVDDVLGNLLSKDNCNFNDWFKLRLKSSLLATADRMDAMNVKSIDFSTPQIISTTEDYIQTLLPSPLSKWRTDIRKRTVENCRKITKPGIYKIALPTGAGKTLTALEIANRLEKKTIIYALPYVSIVDQTAHVLRKLYKTVQEQHHLTESLEIEENFQLGQFVNMFKYWFSPVVVTTFVSFWKSIFSPKYTDTMNFHRLKDSVVIMDEVQSIPSEYFSGFVKVLRKLCQRLNITVLMMTATMPGKNRFQTLSERERFPKKRHQFLYVGESATGEIHDYIDHAKSGMIVLNTKKLALKVFQRLKDQKEKTLLLSKWIIPKERIERIEQIKQLEKSKKHRTLVTTQLVEAGVDLDFQYVLRDLAPLDSIVQTAGRCNRNLRYEQSPITLFKLTNEDNRSYSEYVYEKIKLNITERLLEELTGRQFDETTMNRLLKRYYAEVFGSINNLDIYHTLSFGKWGSCFPLIKKRFPEATLIVDIDGNIKAILDEIMGLPNKLESLDRKKMLWKTIQQYMIEIPVQEAEKWYLNLSSGIIDDEDEDMIRLNDYLYYCSPNTIGKIYTEDEGFILLNQTSSK